MFLTSCSYVCASAVCCLQLCQVDYVERRLERLVQDGMETARHVADIFKTYNLDGVNGNCKWALRCILEEQMLWSTARERFGELRSHHPLVRVHTVDGFQNDMRSF